MSTKKVSRQRITTSGDSDLSPKKRWRYYEVDANLKDAWLEELNSLAVFDLVSICEGHRKSFCKEIYPPHVTLDWKLPYEDQSHHFWAELLKHLEDGFTTGDFEVRVTLSALGSPYRKKRRFFDKGSDILFSSRQTLAYEGMNRDKIKWFEEVIRRIKIFDSEILSFLKSLAVEKSCPVCSSFLSTAIHCNAMSQDSPPRQ